MTHESHEQRTHEHNHGHAGHEHEAPGKRRGLHPAWWIVLGAVLTFLAVLAWMGYPWF
jgi:hypothetical protein